MAPNPLVSLFGHLVACSGRKRDNRQTDGRTDRMTDQPLLRMRRGLMTPTYACTVCTRASLPPHRRTRSKATNMYMYMYTFHLVQTSTFSLLACSKYYLYMGPCRNTVEVLLQLTCVSKCWCYFMGFALGQYFFM